MIFWFLYLLIFPFHVFEEGSVQIADFIILLGVFCNFKNIIKAYFFNEILKYLFWFASYSLLVGLFYSILYQDFNFLKTPFNYLYCYIFIAFVASIAKRNNFNKITTLGIFISLLLQLLSFAKFVSTDELRVVIYFNNPNQLGFWALNMLFICILYSITNNISRSYKLVILLSIIFSFVFVIMSISQAAIVSAISMIIFLLIKNGYIKILSFLAIIILLVFGTNSINTFNNIQLYENAYNRIQARLDGKEDNGGIAGRNYNRIVDFPEYLLFGSGEGKNERFGTFDLNEIHSSYANVLFSYGIIGFIIFFYSYYRVLPRANFFLFLIYISYLSFSLLHNMIRWPLFWVIPVIIFYNLYNKKNHVWN